MQIAIIGSGYVGLVAGACFADLGHDVIVVDNDQKKLSALNRGEVPIHENFLPELLHRHRGGRLKFSDDLENSVRASSAIFVAVGTPPTEQGEADLSYVESVARGISGAINNYKVVVEKSTVPVYTSDWVRKIILRNGAEPGEFDVASNPEFLREGTAVTDFLYPGPHRGRRRHSALRGRAARNLCASGGWKLLPEAGRNSPPRSRTDSPAPDCDQRQERRVDQACIQCFLGDEDFLHQCGCVNLRKRGRECAAGMPGHWDRQPHWAAFLNPGMGYGGSCFPKDLMAFRAVARECGYEFRLLDEVMRINEEQRSRFIRKVRSALWTLRGKKLGVLGLAFKGGTDDIRESPAILLIQSLLQEGCKISAYDPAAQERAQGGTQLQRARWPTTPMKLREMPTRC